MTEVTILQIIAIVGSLLSIIGGFAVYYLKGLNDKMTTMNLGFVKHEAHYENTTEKVLKNELEVTLIKKEQEKTRFRLHTIEGAQGSQFQLYKDLEEEVKKIAT